ncbi:MAG: hypothetical protein GY754_07035 [bacterium]|nr:hypothetical protein [bacterium]
MKFRQVKQKDENNITNLADSKDLSIEKKKFMYFSESFIKGIESYSLFQRFSFFQWPAWLHYSCDPQSDHFRDIVPPILLNNSLREWNSFTNFLSEEELHIDPSGMLSPSYASWSIEYWVTTGKSIFRSQNSIEKYTVEQDADTAILHSTWNEPFFKLKQAIYGARSSIDEAIVDIECAMLGKEQYTALLLVIRPYNNLGLGGISSIEYLKELQLLNIDGKKSIAISRNPDFLLAGNGNSGDIDINDKNSPLKSSCPHGMATFALGYNLNKGKNRLFFRINLSENSDIPPGNYDFEKLREEYIDYSGIRIRKGMNITVPDRIFQNWFYNSKISALNFLKKDIYSNDMNNNDPAESTGKGIDFRSIFYIILGYNKMGYYPESLKLIDFFVKNFKINEKKTDFQDIINGCYILNSLADYFVHTRDIDYLRPYYTFLKDIAAILFKHAASINSISHNKIRTPKNSITGYFAQIPHYFDLVILSFSLNRFSYLARCMGIFGDELKFAKESKRLSDIFLNHIKDYIALNIDEDAETDNNLLLKNINEFFFYDIHAGFPFNLEDIDSHTFKMIINAIFEHFEELPLHIKSQGMDIYSTLIIAINLIIQKDPRAYDIYKKLVRIGGKSYCLPDFLNPLTLRGNWGNGNSKSISSLFFILTRNMLFTDSPERLDLFPVPQKEWFKPGPEIIIDNAPSRFGLINIRVVLTANEIQFHFEKLPKYVPPDIMINLPEKTKIIPEDDFIIKKEEGNSYIINGWPSVVRFIRK